MSINRNTWSGQNRGWFAALSLAGLAVCALLLSACSSGYYRRSADKEVYRILQQVDQRIFGHTNEFTINTRYSDRAPTDIPPAEIFADRSATNQRVVNLDQALELATRNSPEYQSQKEQLYLTALTLTGTRYEFSPQFFANSTAQVAGSPSGSEQGSVLSQIGVDQLLKTGGRLSLALGNDLVRYFTGKPDAVARNSAINTLSVDLTQPLLRGFGVNDPLVEQLTQAERNVVYAVRAFALYQQQFAVDIVNAYFSLLTQKDVVRFDYRNYTNRVQTTRYFEARAVDRESRSSVDYARNNELSARTSYINSLALYLDALDAFKLRLGLPVSESLFLNDQDLKDLMAAGVVPVDLDTTVGFQFCVAKQMDVLNAVDKFEDSKRKVRVAADQLRADLNLFANASLASEGPDDYTNFDPQKVRYTAGIRLNLPIDRLRERNTYRATLVSFESQLRSLATTLDNYRNRIDRGLRTIEEARLNYLDNLESVKVAERRLENNVLSLEAGRATIRDISDAQDVLITAQNNLARVYPRYLDARLQLLVNLGVIDTRPRKFWLTDPLTTLVAPNQRRAAPLRMSEDQILPPEAFIEPKS